VSRKMYGIRVIYENNSYYQYDRHFGAAFKRLAHCIYFGDPEEIERKYKRRLFQEILKSDPRGHLLTLIGCLGQAC